MTTHECTADLPERRRRARFSSTEQRALEAHFTVCASCRIARQISSDFEELNTVDPADGARIERLAALARARVAPAPAASSAARRKLSPARALAVAAALVLFVGSALASVRLWHAKLGASQRARAVLDAASVSGANRVSGASSSTLVASPVTAETSATAALGNVTAAPSGLATLSGAPDPSTARVADVLSAAQLLRQAGDAQRRGERDQAAALYQKLQTQYPTSAEALLSHVSLGRLLAERGQPRAALLQFDRYLSEARGGVLIPEALYGRGRALTGLGDRAEETRTWQRLLRDFPDSAYGEAARRRLAELE